MNKNKLRMLSFEGEGLAMSSECRDLCRKFSIQTNYVEVKPGVEDDSTAHPDVDYVLLHGPWSVGLADSLQSKTLLRCLGKTLSRYMSSEEFPATKILAVGRGALVLLAHLAGKECIFSDWSWEPVLEKEGLWVNVDIDGEAAQSPYKAFCFEKARPELSNPGMLRFLPWLKVSETLIGWKWADRAFFSLVDPFAFQHKAQDSEFGYADLSHVRGGADFFERMFVKP